MNNNNKFKNSTISVLMALDTSNHFKSSDSQQLLPIEKVLEQLKSLNQENFDKGSVETQDILLHTLTISGSDLSVQAAHKALSLDYKHHHIESNGSTAADVQTHLERVLLFSPSSLEGDSLNSRGDAVQDEVALAFCDTVIATWDRRNSSTPFHRERTLIKKALLQRKLVWWIDLNGRIFVSNLQSLSQKALRVLKSDRSDTHDLTQYFSPWDGERIEQLHALIAPTTSPLVGGDEGEKISEYLANHPKPFWPVRVYRRGHDLMSSFIRRDFKGFAAALKKDYSAPWFGTSKSETEHSTHPISEPGIEPVFNWFDISANHFANLHRSSTWLLYLMAAFAVFCATAGALGIGIKGIWPLAELITLIIILLIYRFARTGQWHEKWISHRFIAEQLRYLRMGYPLLVIPEIFKAPIWEEASSESEQKIVMGRPEVWFLQRVLIDTGLPCPAEGNAFNPVRSAPDVARNYVSKIIQGQILHHEKKHSLLHEEHHCLHIYSKGLFVITLIAVILEIIHLKMINHALLVICTTALPALGAAFHGIVTQNETVKVCSLSQQTAAELTHMQKAIEEVSSTDTEASWTNYLCIRELTHDAAQLMSDENNQWHSLIVHQKTELPA